MRSALTLAVTLLLIVAVSAAVAEPYVSVWEDQSKDIRGTSSWFGSTGLIVIPSATTLPATAATLQYHRIQRSSGDINVWGANFGVTKSIEAGATRIDVPGGGSKTVGNLKMGLNVARWLGNPLFPSVAIGVFDLTNQFDRSLYLVLSKSIPLTGIGFIPHIDLHAGFAHNTTETGALDGLFGGVEFQALRYGTIQAEYDGNAFNAALRYNVSGHFSLDLGVLDSDFGYGATYRSQF